MKVALVGRRPRRSSRLSRSSSLTLDHPLSSGVDSDSRLLGTFSDEVEFGRALVKAVSEIRAPFRCRMRLPALLREGAAMSNVQMTQRLHPRGPLNSVAGRTIAVLMLCSVLTFQAVTRNVPAATTPSGRITYLARTDESNPRFSLWVADGDGSNARQVLPPGSV